MILLFIFRRVIMDNSSNEKNDGFMRSLLTKAFAGSIISILAGVILVKWVGWNFTELGPFGDFFAGSTVPIFTLASFIGLILTLRMQKEQLEMQRQELQNSLEEMKETRNEIKGQGRTMALQRFESTFFNMITLHNEIIKSLSVESKNFKSKIANEHDKVDTEREVFITFYHEISKTYRSWGARPNFQQMAHKDRIREVYDYLYMNLEHKLGHYYSHLYRTLKLIDKADITLEEKQEYADILKAQLTGFELTVLLYYGLSTRGAEIFPLLQKYDMLNGLIKEQLIIEEEDSRLYKERSEDVSQNSQGQPVSV